MPELIIVIVVQKHFGHFCNFLKKMYEEILFSIINNVFL